MPSPMQAQDVLNREFLEIRAKILELAASLDRIERAPGDPGTDPRLTLLDQALTILAQKDRQDRAEQIQLLFSRQYESAWRDAFQLTTRKT